MNRNSIPYVPFVSAICPTFGRAPAHLHLLEECLYWWTQQDYPIEKRELVIYNDAANQTIICHTPGVRVINTATRCRTLGGKYDEAITASIGNIIIPWEDDDISLPHRITQVVGKLKDRFYFNPEARWYQENGKLFLDHKQNQCHHAGGYWIDFWKHMGGYGPYTGNQDSHFDQRAKAHGGCADPLEYVTEWSYIYRWGVSNLHLSGVPGLDGMRMAWEGHKASPAMVYLVPKMGRNYTAEVKAIISGAKCAGACARH